MAKSMAPPPPFFARVSNHFGPLVINSNAPASVSACQRRVAGCFTAREGGSVLQQIARRLSASSLGIARSEVNVAGSTSVDSLSRRHGITTCCWVPQLLDP